MDCKILVFSTASRLMLGPTQPLIQWVPGALFLGVKQQGHEADHPFPPRAEVKTGGAIPQLPHMSLWHNSLHGSISQKIELYSGGGELQSSSELFKI
jgi:hypothetical protein